jgi:L-ascorbate metabolism protein UlaG (beta-lactamase superfamily)
LGGHDIWQASITPVVDFDGDGTVNLKDFSKLAQYWRGSGLSVDIGPTPLGDGVVDFRDLAVLTAHWLTDASPPIYIQWLGHSSVKIWGDDIVVYVDPRNLPDALHDATIVCVTHSHSDHYAPADIGKVSNADTVFLGPPDVVAAYGKGQVLAPGHTLTWPDVSITGVPAYNINKTNHPKANNWLGFIVEIASKRVYVAGDTDLTPEMKALQGIDVAILPAGGTYTMDAAEAAEATQYIQPQLAVPYHWGEIVGTLRDVQQFARLAACSVKIMADGEILSSQDWQKDFSLVAHWPLDEQEGDIATDIAGSATGALHGMSLWQSAGGMIAGAVQLDGLESYISTPFVLDPADGAFSAFAWAKGGAPGQVIVSQDGGADWLMADPSEGRLMTTLQKPRGRTPVPPLVSEVVITDGQWHRIGLVWNGMDRVLYVDDVEVARDTQAAPAGSTRGLYLGCGKEREAGTFFSGLIDDVRIHNRAVTP